MNTKEAMITEPKPSPEPLIQETSDHLRFIKNRPPPLPRHAPPPPAWPDFLQRQKENFGNRILPDSRTLLDKLRADRF